MRTSHRLCRQCMSTRCLKSEDSRLQESHVSAIEFSICLLNKYSYRLIQSTQGLHLLGVKPKAITRLVLETERGTCPKTFTGLSCSRLWVRFLCYLDSRLFTLEVGCSLHAHTSPHILQSPPGQWRQTLVPCMWRPPDT
jgi:hypothetical protein